MEDPKDRRLFLLTFVGGLAAAAVGVFLLRYMAPPPAEAVAVAVTNQVVAVPEPPAAQPNEAPVSPVSWQSVRQPAPAAPAEPPVPVAVRTVAPPRPDPNVEIAARLAERKNAERAIDTRVIKDAEAQLRNDERTIIDTFTRNQITKAERQHIKDLRESFIRKYGHQP